MRDKTRKKKRDDTPRSMPSIASPTRLNALVAISSLSCTLSGSVKLNVVFKYRMISTSIISFFFLSYHCI